MTETESHDEAADVTLQMDSAKGNFRTGLSPMIERVWRRLSAEIESGRLTVGQRLPSEMDLAARFMVSRPIIRDALQRLREDGAIYSRRGSGSFVAAVQREAPANRPSFAPVESIADVQRCYEFRMTIEPDAAARAAERHNEERLKTIESALEEMRAATRDNQHHEDADFKFHLAITEASNNHYYASAMLALKEHINVGMKFHGMSLIGHGRDLEHVYEEHVGLCTAIRNRDGVRARRLMQLHLEGSRDRTFGGKLLDLAF